MTIFEFLLIFFGSVFHLSWNILAKNSKDKFSFLFFATFLSGLTGSLFYLSNGGFQNINFLALYYIVISALIHALYFLTLGFSYERSDLSLVYPYCRGIGSLIATLGSLAILRESPNHKALLGIFLTLGATFLEPLSTFNKQKNLRLVDILMTVLTGFGIGSYFLVDKLGVKHLDSGPYLSLLLLLSSIILLPTFLLVRNFQLQFNYFKNYKVYLGAFFILASYGPILKAMETAPLSYVVATRSVGIVLSGLAGFFIFKESIKKWRWMAIFLIACGVYLVGTA